MPKSIAAFPIALLLLAASASVHAAWSSRSEVGFVAARGNTSTETANARFEIMREVEKWKNTVTASGLYGKSGTIQSAQRWDSRYQADHAFSERAFWFGALRYENDRFSGFQYQATVSTGLGRKLIDTVQTKLSVQIGAGYRSLRPEELMRNQAGEVIQRIPGVRNSDIVANSALTFEHAFNEATKLLDSLIVESGQANTSTRNELTLQVKMTEVLALGLGVSVRNNSNPQPELKSTDTLTTINLVYVRAPGP
jgi:putative salt-induced outer membrane protein